LARIKDVPWQDSTKEHLSVCLGLCRTWSLPSAGDSQHPPWRRTCLSVFPAPGAREWWLRLSPPSLQRPLERGQRHRVPVCRRLHVEGRLQIPDVYKDAHTSLGVPTLSIVASTASSVALILLLVVLFVLLQPKLKSFHHSRRDQGVSGDQVSIMVDGVQVALPSYEEAVYGSSGHSVPPADPRVQIVLSEGSGPGGRSGPREQQLQDQGACSSAGGEEEAPGQSGLCEAWGSRGSETVMVHQATTSSWVAGSGNSRVAHKEAPDSENSDMQSLLSLTSEDYTDDIPLLKEA
uniref:Sushi domain containing 6 n=1 Tax=Sus scrofa TaxID=9823 RepID=A0A8D1NY90_PIG